MRVFGIGNIYKLIYVAVILLATWNINAACPLIIAGFIIGLWRRRGNVQFDVVGWIFLSLIVFEAINFLFSIYQDAGYNYFFRMANLFLLYAGLRLFLFDEDAIDWVLGTVVGYSAVVGVLSIINFFIVFNELSAVDWTNFKYLYRPFGYLINDWSAFMLILLPFPIVAFLKSENRMVQLCYVSVEIILIFNILVSFSRGAYLGLLLFIMLMAVIVITSLKKYRKTFAYIGLGVTLFLLVTTIPVRESIVSTVLLETNTSQSRSIQGRIFLWSEVLSRIDNLPVIGVGSGNFAITTSTSREDSFFTGRALSTPVQLVVEKGVAGFVLYGGVIVIFACSCYRSLGRLSHKDASHFAMLFMAGLISVLIKELTFSSFFEMDALASVVCIVLAALTSLETTSHRYG